MIPLPHTAGAADLYTQPSMAMSLSLIESASFRSLHRLVEIRFFSNRQLTPFPAAATANLSEI
jgi:hypothetical protein